MGHSVALVGHTEGNWEQRHALELHGGLRTGQESAQQLDLQVGHMTIWQLVVAPGRWIPRICWAAAGCCTGPPMSKVEAPVYMFPVYQTLLWRFMPEQVFCCHATASALTWTLSVCFAPPGQTLVSATGG